MNIIRKLTIVGCGSYTAGEGMQVKQIEHIIRPSAIVPALSYLDNDGNYGFQIKGHDGNVTSVVAPRERVIVEYGVEYGVEG